LANEEVREPNRSEITISTTLKPDARQRVRWVAACDSYDDIDRAIEDLTGKIGYDSEEKAEANRRDSECGCTKKILYAVVVVVTRVR